MDRGTTPGAADRTSRTGDLNGGAQANRRFWHRAGEAVDDFLTRLPAQSPPLARITAVSVRDLPCNGDRRFEIVATGGQENACTLISPDVAICVDCLRELFDPGDRRYKYPFIN